MALTNAKQSTDQPTGQCRARAANMVNPMCVALTNAKRSTDQPTGQCRTRAANMDDIVISHKHKFIFIHISKTAGTSMETVLRDESCQLLPGQWDTARIRHTPLNHLTLQELVDYNMLTPAQLKSYFKFCFVRNPWDRLISEIFCRWMSPWFRDLTTEARIRWACQLATDPTGVANHLRPQVDFVNAAGLHMDFIGRFEYLEEDFAYLCHLLGLSVTLPHLNRSTRDAYQSYYTAETQALVTATYQRDIDAFHYTFPAAPTGHHSARPVYEQVDAYQPLG